MTTYCSADAEWPVIVFDILEEIREFGHLDVLFER